MELFEASFSRNQSSFVGCMNFACAGFTGAEFSSVNEGGGSSLSHDPISTQPIHEGFHKPSADTIQSDLLPKTLKSGDFYSVIV